MKRALSILFLSVVSFSAYCQGFVPGYVVTNENDTIRGLIRDKAIKTGVKTCALKRDKKAAETVYELNQLKSLGFDEGPQYIAGRVIGFNEDVFLKYLFKGRIDVFTYRKNRQDYILLSKNGALTILSGKPDTVYQGGPIALRKSNRYMRQLHVLMSDAAIADAQIRSTPYGARPITSLVKKYHKLTSPNDPYIDFLEREKNFELQVGVFVSRGFPKLEVDRHLLAGYYGINRWDFSSNSATSAGFQLNLTPRSLRRLSLQIEPSYCKARYRSDVEYDEYYIEHYKVRNDITFEVESIQMPLSIMFVFLQHDSKIRPFIQAGIWKSYFLRTSSLISYELTGASRSGSGSYNNFPFGDRQSGYSFSAGLRCKLSSGALFINGKYETGSGIHKESENPSKAYKNLTSTKGFNIQIGYIF